MNVADALVRAARHFPDTDALVFEGAPTTYGALSDQVARVAAGFAAAGIQPGDRVALLLPNIPAFIVAYQACQWLGAITVSLNVMLTTDEIRYVLEDSGASVLCTTEQLFPAAAGLIAPDHVVCCAGHIDGARSLADIAQRAPARAPRERDPSDPAAILYTSGTTGRQKGATLSVGNIVFNASMTRHYLGITRSDRLVLFLPLFHVFGQNVIALGACAAAATVVLYQRYDPQTIVASIERDSATMFFAVPTIYIGLLDNPTNPHRLRSVRYWFSAAATMPTPVAKQWHDAFGRPIYEGYGLTETSPFASYNHEWQYRPASVGTALDATEIRILDPHDVEVERGTWGEICMRGPHVMLGYWNRPEDNAEVLRNGWFHSGDVGYMDHDGYIFLVDRIKDMINSAGFKIWPREVEEVLYQHQDVAECAVYGVPDPIKGEIAYAAVVRVLDASVSADELAAFCRQHLASYKVPRLIELVDRLPKSATGKILKRELRTRAGRTVASA